MTIINILLKNNGIFTKKRVQVQKFIFIMIFWIFENFFKYKTAIFNIHKTRI